MNTDAGCLDCGAALRRRHIGPRCRACLTVWTARYSSYCTGCGVRLPDTSALDKCQACITALATALLAGLRRGRANGFGAAAATYPTRAIDAVSRALGVPGEMLTSARRERALVWARCAVAAGMRRRGASLPRIGRRIGRDHSTVSHGLRIAQQMAPREPLLAALIELAEEA